MSRSGYYAYINRPESKCSIENRALLKTIKDIHTSSYRIYGSPQITKNLPPGQKASRGRVARLMRTNGIRSKMAKKYKATTNSKHNLPVAENIVNQNFEASNPNEKWLSDITYIPTEEGWLYLAGVLDLYGRRLVGWAMDSRMKTELVSYALKQAIGRTGATKGLTVHSDRGVQYASKGYPKLGITAEVVHTEDWEANRLRWNKIRPKELRSPSTFWAGERFVLQARTTDTGGSITKAAKVEVAVERIGSTTLTSPDKKVWSGYIGTEQALIKLETLKDGDYVFHFKATYTNGVVKETDVTIQIKDNPLCQTSCRTPE